MLPGLLIPPGEFRRISAALAAAPQERGWVMWIDRAAGWLLLAAFVLAAVLWVRSFRGGRRVGAAVIGLAVVAAVIAVAAIPRAGAQEATTTTETPSSTSTSTTTAVEATTTTAPDEPTTTVPAPGAGVDAITRDDLAAAAGPVVAGVCACLVLLVAMVART